MPDVRTLLAGWGCLGLGLLFMFQGGRLIRAEKRLGRRPLTGEPFSGRELLAEGLAVALIGTGNLLGGRWPVAGGRWPVAGGRWPVAGGRWVLLVVPGVIVMVVLLVQLVLLRARRPSGGSH